MSEADKINLIIKAIQEDRYRPAQYKGLEVARKQALTIVFFADDSGEPVVSETLKIETILNLLKQYDTGAN